MPIAFLLCCTTGHFDGSPDCIAEVMLRQPKGPVAVIASSRVSMPYGNAPIAKELLGAFFVDRKATLGEAFMQAKRLALEPKAGDVQRAQIEMLSNIYEADKEKRRRERIEHLYLYNLLGDPSMRLPHPDVVKLTAPEQAAPGSTVEITVDAPRGGSFRVDLMADRTPFIPGRKGNSDKEFQRTYVRERLITTTYDVRIWIASPAGTALGTTRLKIR